MLYTLKVISYKLNVTDKRLGYFSLTPRENYIISAIHLTSLGNCYNASKLHSTDILPHYYLIYQLPNEKRMLYSENIPQFINITQYSC